VHFMVSGFHQVVVYDPGTKPKDIVVPSSGTFINDLTDVFYLGIPPQGGPPPVTPPTTNPFNGSNRQESVSFSDRGTYLVICNVRTHFLDGMFAQPAENRDLPVRMKIEKAVERLAVNGQQRFG
jgi:hypothetical protein